MPMPTFSAMLRTCAWARSLSAADLARIEADTITRDVAAGTLVCRKGEAVEAWIGVVDGLVKMANVSIDGKPTSFTGIPSDIQFGGSLAFDKGNMIATFDYGMRCASRGLVWVTEKEAEARGGDTAPTELTPFAKADCPLIPRAR